MMKDIVVQFPRVRKFLQSADDILRIRLSTLMIDGSEVLCDLLVSLFVGETKGRAHLNSERTAGTSYALHGFASTLKGNLYLSCDCLSLRLFSLAGVSSCRLRRSGRSWI